MKASTVFKNVGIFLFFFVIAAAIPDSFIEELQFSNLSDPYLALLKIALLMIGFAFAVRPLVMENG